MAKQRYINTKFWSDSFIVDLNPLDRYLFFYLLTNEHTNIAGIYELPLVRMAQESGIDKEMLPKMLSRLESRIRHMNGWVIIKNFQKHQKLNDSVKKGMERVMSELPEEISRFYTAWVQTGGSLSTGSELSEPEPEPEPELESKPKLESAVTPDLFELFWTEYPNKKAKKKAQQIWRRLKVDQNLYKEIMSGLSSYKNSKEWQKDNGQFIPHPATWLNNERWNDVIASQNGTPKRVLSCVKCKTVNSSSWMETSKGRVCLNCA